MYHCYFLINYIVPPKVFFLSFGPLFKKFAHHCSRGMVFSTIVKRSGCCTLYNSAVLSLSGRGVLIYFLVAYCWAG